MTRQIFPQRGYLSNTSRYHTPSCDLIDFRLEVRKGLLAFFHFIQITNIFLHHEYFG